MLVSRTNWDCGAVALAYLYCDLVPEFKRETIYKDILIYSGIDEEGMLDSEMDRILRKNMPFLRRKVRRYNKIPDVEKVLTMLKQGDKLILGHYDYRNENHFSYFNGVGINGKIKGVNIFAGNNKRRNIVKQTFKKYLESEGAVLWGISKI